jgi:hypothetical protein
MATRKELSERILRLVYNGTPPNDASIDIREVGLHVNSAIAFLAKVNYTENYKFEGTSYVNDQFVSTFTGNTIHTDATLGLKYCDLPADPIGLPKNRGIIEILKPLNKSVTPVIILQGNKKSIYKNLTPIPNRIVGWEENGRIYFDGSTADLVTVVIRMVAYGSNTMAEELMMPKDMEEQVIEIVLKKLLGERNIPQDKVLDGVDSINR